MEVEILAETVLAANRKGPFRSRPIFKAHAEASASGLNALEERIRAPIPKALRQWLLTVGFGDLDEQLSFRAEWFEAIETGQIRGSARFAQDILGNFYAFEASTGSIYYLSRTEPAFAKMATDFSRFIEELIHRDYKLVAWTDALQTHKYEW